MSVQVNGADQVYNLARLEVVEDFIKVADFFSEDRKKRLVVLGKDKV